MKIDELTFARLTFVSDDRTFGTAEDDATGEEIHLRRNNGEHIVERGGRPAWAGTHIRGVPVEWPLVGSSIVLSLRQSSGRRPRAAYWGDATLVHALTASTITA